MKSSAKILIGVVIAISFLVGFFIGITVNSQKTDKQELAGTFGKYLDSEVVDNNMHLRADLLSNEVMLNKYRKYYNFHSSSCVKLCEDLDFAIQTSEKIPEYMKGSSTIIENVKQYRLSLQKTLEDISLANTSLQQISQSNENEFPKVINNANIGIAQINDKENCMPTFVESVEKFISGNNPYKYSDLIKAHDMFAINQLVVAQ